MSRLHEHIDIILHNSHNRFDVIFMQLLSL